MSHVARVFQRPPRKRRGSFCGRCLRSAAARVAGAVPIRLGLGPTAGAALGLALTAWVGAGVAFAEESAAADRASDRDPAAAGAASVLAQPGQSEAEVAAGRLRLAEHLEAINTVEAAIESIERQSGRYDEALLQPLVVLGDALAGVGDPDGALGAYDRALHVARVNRGLHHPSQVDVVYRKARLHATGGDYATAAQQHRYAFEVLRRSFGEDNAALLPGLFVLADWHKTNYNIFEARMLYEQAEVLAADGLGRGHPARIRALRHLARTYRDERFPPFYTRRERRSSRVGSYTGFEYRQRYRAGVNSFAKGERALIEVINVVQGRAEASKQEVAEAMLDLGDWFTMFEKHGRAVVLYRRVWELLEDSPVLRARTFGAPKPLYMPLPRNPPKPKPPSTEMPRDGLVELSVDVDERGFVSGIDTVRAEPAELMDFKVRRAVKRARYRPAFDGTAPHATQDMRVTHTFVYYPSTLPEDADAAVGGAGLDGELPPVAAVKVP